MTQEQLSKSARRRLRKKQAQQGAQAPAVSNPVPEPEIIPETPDNSGDRQLTVSLRERHGQVFDWLCGGQGTAMQSEAATRIIREYCIKQLPRWREAQGMKSSSVRAEDFKAPE